jgi:hypothetical protein
VAPSRDGAPDRGSPMATKIPFEIPNDLTELRPWTLLTSHAHVLLAIAQDPTRIVPEIAAAAQISERSAYRILSDLQRAGYLRKRKLGRRNRYEIAVEAPLLDPLVGHSPIGGLLALALRERVERRSSDTSSGDNRANARLLDLRCGDRGVTLKPGQNSFEFDHSQ